MKKTTNIHIKGVPFIMEEDAYQLLDDYLKRLKVSLGNQEGADEIVEDIELRIAELLNDISKTETTVIEERHVKEVMAILGDPQDYATDDSEPVQPTEEQTSTANGNVAIGRSLFRDKDNAWIGGVCAGIATYLNINVVLIRLALIVFFLAGGSGVLIYLILWIIMPRPKTNLDYLRMKGEPINIESIKEQFAKTSQQFGQNAKDAASEMNEQAQNFGKSIRNNEAINQVTTQLTKIVRIVAGAILIAMGISSLIGTISLLIGHETIINSNGLSFGSYNLTELLFPSSGIKALAWFSVFAIGGSFAFFLISSGVITMLNAKFKYWKMITLSLFVIGLIGIFTGIYSTVATVKEFKSGVEIVENIKNIKSDQLTINISNSESILSNGRKRKMHNTTFLYELKGNYLYDSGYNITYKESKDSNYHVDIIRNSQGANVDEATKKANNIQFHYTIDGDVLTLDSFYKFPKENKIRGQRMSLIIYIPKGKEILIDEHKVSFNEPTKYDLEEEPYEIKKTKSASIDSRGRYWQYDN